MNADLYWTLVLAGVTLLGVRYLPGAAAELARRFRRELTLYRTRLKGIDAHPFVVKPWPRREARCALLKGLIR